jgi:hypothetical protein
LPLKRSIPYALTHLPSCHLYCDQDSSARPPVEKIAKK